MIQQITSSSGFLNPKNILEKVGLVAGEKVADLGCGGGYFVIQAARMVGDKGLVYGIDVLKSVLSSLQSKANMFGLTNVRTVWSNVEVYGGAKAIPGGSLDLALLVQLLFQSIKRDDIFIEATRMLKKGGQAVVIDWKNDKLSFGPKQGKCVTVDQVKICAEKNDFKFIKEIVVGPYHYGLIFQKK